MLDSKQQPSRNRHPLTAFIEARKLAERAFDGTVDECACCPITFEAMLRHCNGQDASAVERDKEFQGMVVRGVSLVCLPAEASTDKVWTFVFRRRPQEAGQAPAHSPKAAADWRRRGR